MDNQNTEDGAQQDSHSVVLILVLMDNQNTRRDICSERRTRVLILVLMDNQNTYENGVTVFMQSCLNPCSNG